MKIKEISRVNLGMPCKWDLNKCPYCKNGANLDCTPKGYRCNGNKFKVIYKIDGDPYAVIEAEEFTEPLKGEIDINVSLDYLLKGFRNGDTLDYLLKMAYICK